MYFSSQHYYKCPKNIQKERKRFKTYRKGKTLRDKHAKLAAGLKAEKWGGVKAPRAKNPDAQGEGMTPK